MWKCLILLTYSAIYVIGIVFFLPPAFPTLYNIRGRALLIHNTAGTLSDEIFKKKA